MIEFIDVSKIYNIGGNIVRALDHANMRIDLSALSARPAPENQP